jgi:hypothetical protein
MKVNEQGLNNVASRFLKRKEVEELGLSIDELKQVLLEHAKRFSGCINCIFSAPYHGKFSWTARHCILGLSQTGCTMQKPIVLG